MALCHMITRLNRLANRQSMHNIGQAATGHQFSTSQAYCKKTLNDYTVMTDDGSTIVCWHPEREFPYEHTKPLPVIEPRVREGDSVLKLQVRVDSLKRGYRNERLEIEELCKLTYTTKHRWYPRNEEKYKDPNPPIDREGL
ncbi:large ribosomal subunit protein mL42-like [Ornithodoros turicata]|uniref:large ribosomal subunit protein mL42-like n=1 Tax=Ornithodoros turicata TaxID=34597 RepID=UPI00313946A4